MLAPFPDPAMPTHSFARGRQTTPPTHPSDALIPMGAAASSAAPQDRQAATRSFPDADQDLLDRLAAHDAAAWREVVARYERLVRTRVRGFRLQPADADDAVQATWLRLAQNADRIKDPSRLPGWLATVAGRECLRILDRSSTSGIPTQDVGTDLPEPAAGPEQQAIDADVAGVVRALVARLPRRRRMLIAALFGDQDWSYERISRLIGIPTGSIGPTRARALEQLRAMLAHEEIGQETGTGRPATAPALAVVAAG